MQVCVGVDVFFEFAVVLSDELGLSYDFLLRWGRLRRQQVLPPIVLS